MTATYIYPGFDNVSLVRWYLGDTATGEGDESGIVVNPLVSDAEIVFALNQKNGNAKAAAAFCARYAATKLIHDVQSIRLLDFSASSNVSPKDIADRFLLLAEKLEGEVVRPGIYAGGISVSDKESVAANTDRDAPSFRRGMHDYENWQG